MHFDMSETVILYAVAWIICTLLQRNHYNIYTKSIRGINGVLHIKVSSLLSALSFTIFFFLITFRENVGNDYVRYTQLYYAIGNNELTIGELAWLENSIAYLIINKLVFLCGLSYRFVFAFFAFISLYFVYKGIKALSVNWTMSIFLYVGLCQFYQNFNIMRQLAAVSIIFWGWTFLEQNDCKKFIFTILVACIFHSTAFICLILWPLHKIEMTQRNVLRYIFAGLVFFFYFNRILSLFSWYGYVGAYSGSMSHSRMYGLSTILNSGVRIALFFFCLYFYKDVVREYGTKYVALYNIAAVCTITQLGAMKFNVFGRATVYFFIVYIVLLPAVFKVMEKRFKRNSRIIVRLLEILWVILYHYTYYFSPQGASGSGYMFYNFIS